MPTNSVFPAKARPFWNGNTSLTAKTTSPAASYFKLREVWQLTSLLAEFFEEKFKLFGIGLTVVKKDLVSGKIRLTWF